MLLYSPAGKNAVECQGQASQKLPEASLLKASVPLLRGRVPLTYLPSKGPASYNTTLATPEFGRGHTETTAMRVKCWENGVHARK